MRHPPPTAPPPVHADAPAAAVPRRARAATAAAAPVAGRTRRPGAHRRRRRAPPGRVHVRPRALARRVAPLAQPEGALVPRAHRPARPRPGRADPVPAGGEVRPGGPGRRGVGTSAAVPGRRHRAAPGGGTPRGPAAVPRARVARRRAASRSGVAAISYSSEVKQYGIDALVTGLLLLVLIAGGQGAADARPRAPAWRCAGAAAVWCSDPAVFVLAGGGGGAAHRRRVRRATAPGSRALGGIAAAWLASFAALYVVHVRDLYGGARTRDGRPSGGSSGRGVGDRARHGAGDAVLGRPRPARPPAHPGARRCSGFVVLWRSGRRVEAGILGLPVAAFVAGRAPRPVPRRSGARTLFLAPALAVAFAAGVPRGLGRRAGAGARRRGGRRRGRRGVCAMPWVARLSDTSLASEEIDTVTAALARDASRPATPSTSTTRPSTRTPYYGHATPGIRFRALPTRGPGAAPRDAFSDADRARCSRRRPGRVVGPLGADAGAATARHRPHARRAALLDRVQPLPSPTRRRAMVRRARGLRAAAPTSSGPTGRSPCSWSAVDAAVGDRPGHGSPGHARPRA